MAKNKITWTINKTIGLFFFGLTHLFPIRQDKNMYLFGLRELPSYKNDRFYFNTKYMFLYLCEHYPDIKSVWLCDDKEMLRKFHKRGYKNVYSRNSLKGIWSFIRAKYWFIDMNANQITKYSCSLIKSEVINFWHGAGGLKRVGIKDYKTSACIKNRVVEWFYHLMKKNDDYYILNSTYEGECRKSAFGARDKQIKILGSPRLDALYNDIKDSDLFMEDDFNNIKQLKEQGKKLFVYMPTFRDTGKDISSWLLSDKLKQFLKDNNVVLICKLHHMDENPIDFNSKEFYKVSNSADIYPILKYTDALITDYSSVFFDYLHLDKPILYYIPDIEEYIEQCRGFYRPYETLTAGVYAKTEKELLTAMQDVIDGKDEYKTTRKTLRDEMFVYQDGNNCQRCLDFVKSLGDK